MKVEFGQIAQASTLSSQFHNCLTRVRSWSRDRRYVEIYRQNLQLLTSSYRALEFAGLKWRFRARALALSIEVGAFWGATVLGNYGERGDIATTRHYLTRKLAHHLHYAAALVALIALAVLAWNGSWLKIVAATGTLALKILNQGSGVLRQERFDLILNLGQFALHSASDPLSLANIFSAKFLIDFAAQKLLRSIVDRHITSSRNFSTGRRRAAAAVIHPLRCTPKIVRACLMADPAQLTLSFLRVETRHIRPYLPELEQPTSAIADLIELFDSIDWWPHRSAVFARLRSDRAWILQDVDAPKTADQIGEDALTPAAFIQSEEWTFVSTRFRDLIESIARGNLAQTSAETMLEAQHNCRYILQKLAPLRESQSVLVTDQLLHLALEASSNCASSSLIALRQVMKNLEGFQEPELERGVARLLCNLREGFFVELYNYLAEQNGVIAQLLCSDFSDPQIYQFFRSLAALHYGLNAGGCFDDLMSVSDLGLLVLLLAGRYPLQKFLSSAYRPEVILDTLEEGFQTGTLSTAQLFDWLRQIAEREVEGAGEGLLGELAEEKPRFFGTLVFRDVDNPDPKLVDRRILTLLLIELDVLKFEHSKTLSRAALNPE